MSIHRFSRRGLLKTLGASAAFAPVIPLLETDALGAGSPKRVLMLWNMLGVRAMEYFNPKTDASGNVTGGALITEPLMPMKDEIFFPTNVRWSAGQMAKSSQKGGHWAVGTTAWTPHGNLKPKPATIGGGRSVDHYLGDKLGKETPFPSLYLGVFQSRNQSATTASHTGAGQRVPARNNPAEVFQQLFGDAVKGGTTAPDVPPEQIFAQDKSILDFLRRDIDRLMPRVGSKADRLKIEAHLQGLRDQESSMQKRATITCDGNAETPKDMDVASDPSVPDITRYQIANTVRALKCDLTRVNLLQFTTLGALHSWLGINSHFHDNCTHGPTPEKLPPAQAWWMGQINGMLQAMKDTPDGDGSLLDNTLVLWLTEFDDAAQHRYSSAIPSFFAGGRNIVPKMPRGKSIRLPAEKWHTDLQLTLAYAMGITGETLGAPASNFTGPLKEVLG